MRPTAHPVGDAAHLPSLRDEFPAATLLLTTVYDPTDGSGLLPDLSERCGRLPGLVASP